MTTPAPTPAALRAAKAVCDEIYRRYGYFTSTMCEEATARLIDAEMSAPAPLSPTITDFWIFLRQQIARESCMTTASDIFEDLATFADSEESLRMAIGPASVQATPAQPGAGAKPIQRWGNQVDYDRHEDGGHFVNNFEDPEGDWVRYSDHQAEVQRLKDEITVALSKLQSESFVSKNGAKELRQTAIRCLKAALNP